MEGSKATRAALAGNANAVLLIHSSTPHEELSTLPEVQLYSQEGGVILLGHRTVVLPPD